jgi:cardiolipin synthase
VRRFRPLSWWRWWRNDKRTHRKVLVCDDHVAFTGGVGIADEWTGDARGPGEWRETHARFVGPAVALLKAAFMDNWNSTGEHYDARGLEVPWPEPTEDGGVEVFVIRANPSPGWTDVATLLRTLVVVAEEELLLTTPYFHPDSELVRLLCVAARDRGVRVRIMFPDQRMVDERMPLIAGRRHWGELLEAGVELWRYRRTMLHAKQYTVDGLVTCVGSPNLNHRSIGKDAECCVVMLDPLLAREARGHFERDLEGCDPISIDDWNQRGWLERASERLLHPIGSEL